MEDFQTSISWRLSALAGLFQADASKYSKNFLTSESWWLSASWSFQTVALKYWKREASWKNIFKCPLKVSPPVNATVQQKEEKGKRLVCDKRNMAITSAFYCNRHWTLRFLVVYKKSCSKDSEVWQSFFSNKIIVTLVTQGFPSSFLSHPVA